MYKTAVSKTLLILALVCSLTVASASESKDEEAFSPVETIMHHISDAHNWHIYGEGAHAVSIPLPIILFSKGSFIMCSSSAFHHNNDGSYIVNKNGQNLAMVHEKIYVLDKGESAIIFDKNHHPINAKKPLDFSITKNVLSLFIVAILLIIIFKSVGDFYKKNGAVAPRGIAKFVEPIIVFIEEDIAVVNIGKEKSKQFMPFLLTAFFFIWFSNMLGMIPIFPGGANLTGNIAVTLVLALFTAVITNINGNKQYWGHIFWMPGTPFFVKLILTPIEIIGILSKPFALMIRLFANITAGHIIVLSLVSLIFVFNHIGAAAIAVPFALFISILEVLVAFLQAYVFCMLSALFIGSAVAEHH